MEEIGCKIICGTPTTLAVKGLMMMMMMMMMIMMMSKVRLTLIWYPFHSLVTAVARKTNKPTKNGHSAKSAGDRLHQNTHTPLTQRSRSGLICHCPARKEKATTTILIPIILYLPHYSLRVYSSQTIYLSIVD